MAFDEKKWEAENAADTLMRAEELKQKPGLHKKAISVLQERQKALAQVVDPNDGAAIRKKRRGGSGTHSMRTNLV